MEYKSIIAIRFHVFNELKKTYQNAIAKDVEIEKCACEISVLVTKCENIR